MCEHTKYTKFDKNVILSTGVDLGGTAAITFPLGNTKDKQKTMIDFDITRIWP